MTEPEIVQAALDAYEAAARQQFEREGSTDYGACGGSMVGYSGNTRFAKALEASGRAYRSDGKVWLRGNLPEGVRTQSANVYQAAARAFRKVAEAHGFYPAKAWDYID